MFDLRGEALLGGGSRGVLSAETGGPLLACATALHQDRILAHPGRCISLTVTCFRRQRRSVRRLPWRRWRIEDATDLLKSMLVTSTSVRHCQTSLPAPSQYSSACANGARRLPSLLPWLKVDIFLVRIAPATWRGARWCARQRHCVL